MFAPTSLTVFPLGLHPPRPSFCVFLETFFFVAFQFCFFLFKRIHSFVVSSVLTVPLSSPQFPAFSPWDSFLLYHFFLHVGRGERITVNLEIKMKLRTIELDTHDIVGTLRQKAAERLKTTKDNVRLLLGSG